MSLKSHVFRWYGICKYTKLLRTESIYKNISKCFPSTVNSINNIHIRYITTEVNTKKDQNPLKQIYEGPLKHQIKAVKMFSLSSSIVGIIAQPFLYKEIMVTGNVPIIIAAYSFIGFFTVVTPFLLHFITKKYVTNLSYDEDRDIYIAKTLNFFCITQETEFKINDVKVPEVPGMFTTIHVHGKPIFFDPRMFEYPEHYAKIMGYDKPIDFKLYEKE